jgi:hypothetical protein
MIRGWSVKNTKNPPGQTTYKRGIMNDNAKTLGDVIERVRRSDALDDEEPITAEQAYAALVVLDPRPCSVEKHEALKTVHAYITQTKPKELT